MLAEAYDQLLTQLVCIFTTINLNVNKYGTELISAYCCCCCCCCGYCRLLENENEMCNNFLIFGKGFGWLLSVYGQSDKMKH